MCPGRHGAKLSSVKHVQLDSFGRQNGDTERIGESGQSGSAVVTKAAPPQRKPDPGELATSVADGFEPPCSPCVTKRL